MDAVNRGESALSCKDFATRALGLLLAMSLATFSGGQTPETGSPLAELPTFGAPMIAMKPHFDIF